MSKKSSITILVCYHKPDHVFKNSVLRPIELGRALRCEAGAAPLAGMFGDDGGENISRLNPMFCEMTALYWAWRNYADLGDPDYCGLMHYRRLLDFSAPGSLGVSRVQNVAEVKAESFAPKSIYSVVPKYDICVKAPIGLTHPDGKGGRAMYQVLEQYLATHDDELLAEAFALAVEKYPDYAEDAAAYAASTAHYLCNIMVMRRELFFDYSEWMFSILLPLHERINYQQPGRDIRAISYISERLTGLYLTRQRRLRRLKIKHIPGININCW